MDMVGHENPGMNGHPVLAPILVEPIRIRRKVLVASKAYRPVVTPLDNMLRHSRDAYSAKSRDPFLLDRKPRSDITTRAEMEFLL